MIKHSIFILSTAWVSVSPAFATDLCNHLLFGQMKETGGLIAYLSALTENQIIGDEELLRFIEGLENGKILNPIREEQTWIKSSAMIHHEGIQKYIEDQTLDPARLLAWAKQSLSEKKRVRRAREETRVETHAIYQKMEFHPVPAGSFIMGEGKNPVTTTLAHSFEMMSTPVTQKMWVELMGENPSQFIHGDHTMTIAVGNKAIHMQPNHPVEAITWWSTLEYANRLSLKAGLKPVYDLSGVKFISGTSAKAGTLQFEQGALKINAPDENIYLTEGYRLPTEAEMQYVMTAAGKNNGKYHFGDDETELKNYAWFEVNSNDQTHPVAELKSLTIEGKDFYDLHGNVQEWSQNWTEPESKTNNPNRMICGGGWNSSALSLRSAAHGVGWANGGYRFVGFRLVRTLK